MVCSLLINNRNMAFILKTGRAYTDNYGVTHNDPYMLINNNMANSIPTRGFSFSIEIYATEDMILGGFAPIFTHTYRMNTADINSYLVTPKPAESMESPLLFARKQVYLYLITEMPPAPTIVWDDWESDE